ncbi:hypothetical protein [Paraburkholderia unamae]|uniref:RseA-like anti sigma(E) protein n=1 Tax=Paraburkholderia unamae TaxID=219649 RepID=A0ABX5KS98_9BURK|nr:hypothetical protein [Paraburkholderia unamae]PVX85736.1 hypothetical protein C7402_103314 [Paraburkholderia unamae]
MEIDLREIQALHARYAAEPVVIDLEAQVRALPAPVMLIEHASPAYWPSLRGFWDARGRIGRGALMAVGGTVLCAAMGMGVARGWERLHSGPGRAASAVAAPTPAATASLASTTPVQGADRSASAAQPPSTASRVAGMASLDIAILTREPSARSGQPQVAPTPPLSPAAADAQRALASPIRQRAAASLPSSAVQVAMPGPEATAVATVQIAASSSAEHTLIDARAEAQHKAHVAAGRSEAEIHRAAPRHLAAQHKTASASDTAKPAAAPAQRAGDVQLF